MEKIDEFWGTPHDKTGEPKLPVAAEFSLLIPPVAGGLLQLGEDLELRAIRNTTGTPILWPMELKMCLKREKDMCLTYCWPDWKTERLKFKIDDKKELLVLSFVLNQ